MLSRSSRLRHGLPTLLSLSLLIGILACQALAQAPEPPADQPLEQATQPQPVANQFAPDLRINNTSQVHDLREVGRWWIGPADLSPGAALAMAARNPLALPVRNGLTLSAGESLYGHVRLQFLPPELPTEWRLAIPLPTLDLAWLHYREHNGTPAVSWSTRQTGDRLAMSRQPLSQLSPVLDFPVSNSGLEFVIELHHPSGALSVPIQLTPVEQVAASQTRRALMAGALLGLSGLMAVICAVEALRSRRRELFLFTLLLLLITLSIAVHNGVAAIYLWPQWPRATHWARFIVPCLVMGAWIQTNAWLLGFDQHSKAVWRTTLGWVATITLLGLAMPLFGDGAAVRVLTLMQGLSIVFVAALGALAWYLRREGAKTVLAALLVISVASGITSLQLLGVIRVGALGWEAFPIGLALASASLFIAVIGRQRALLQAAGRSDALASHDPLTGLPNETALRYSFARSMHRMAFYKHQSLVVMIEVANMAEITRETGDSAQAEALVRISALLRDTLRQFDLLVKLENHRFVALVEGPITVAKAHDLATRMLAAVLRAHVRGITPQLQLAMTDVGGADASLDNALSTCERLLATDEQAPVGSRGRAIHTQFSPKMTDPVTTQFRRRATDSRPPDTTSPNSR